jgi:hypothetical protein
MGHEPFPPEDSIMQEAFEPIIVCFCCHWCSYAAADLA